MKKFLGITLCVPFLVAVGCGQPVVKNVVVAPAAGVKPSPSSDGVVIGHLQDVFAGKYNRWYNVTLIPITKVGKTIGAVDDGTDMPKNAALPSGPGGLSSNVLPVYTKVYEIPRISPTKALAVQWNGQYVEAVRSHDKAVTLPDKTELGWQGRLYKVITPIDATNVGHQIGTVSYHGQISGAFAVLILDGANPKKTVVFRSPTGDYFEAVSSPN